MLLSKQCKVLFLQLFGTSPLFRGGGGGRYTLTLSIHPSLCPRSLISQSCVPRPSYMAMCSVTATPGYAMHALLPLGG